VIPRPVAWRVRFLRDGKTVAEIRVVTVSRLFARWLAVEEFPQGFAIGTQIRISRVKPECPAALPSCNASAYSRMK
jgi:hypothetical protein